jgi:hypothetical protein
MQLFTKIWKTGIATELLRAADPDAVEIGRALDASVKRLLGRALAIREVDAGSCNGCEIEIQGLPGRSTTWSGSACTSSPLRATPTCCSSPGR